MDPRAFTLETQKLYNGIADVLDYENSKYDQGTWANTVEYWMDVDGNKYVKGGMGADPNYTGEMEPVIEHQSCNTSGCIAGWACLLHGYHPTVIVEEVDETIRLHRDYLPDFITSYIRYNYDVMCNLPNVPTPKLVNVDNGVEHLLKMEDIDDIGDGILHYDELQGGDWSSAYGHEAFISNVDEIPKDAYFIRPDSRAADLLNLDHEEQSIIFSGDNWWTGADIRDLGKGVDVYALEGVERCNDCDYVKSLCEC